MKNSLFTLLLVLLVLPATAQLRLVRPAAVPEPIRNTFREDYPKAVTLNWKASTQNNGEYVVNFRDDAVRRRSRYAADGTAIHHSVARKATEVPTGIASAAASSNPGLKIVWAVETDSRSDGKTYWTLQLSGGGQAKVVLYDANGTEIPLESLKALKEESAEGVN